MARRRGEQPRAECVAALEAPFRTTQLEVLVVLGDDCVDARDLARLERVTQEPSLAGWCTNEVVRLQGVVAQRSGTTAAAREAEACFVRALDGSARRGELGLELRAATSLALLRQAQGRRAEARELLAPIYRRFSEGQDTSDLQRATSLLSTL